MDAHNLFESAGCSTALARTTDPQTSKDAAKKMIETGKLNRQEMMVYQSICNLCRTYPKYWKGFTTKDIAEQLKGSPLLYYKNYDICRKRFSGLAMKGKIERTGEKRDGCCVWRLL